MRRIKGKLTKTAIASSILFAIVGIILMVVNVAGLFTTLRNKDIYSGPTIDSRFLAVYTYNQALQELKRAKGNNNIEEKLEIINETVHKSITHYWDNKPTDKYNLRIPIYDNYLLYFAGLIWSDYKKYEFCTNYKKALERGVGLCSQQAIIVSNILTENNIKNNIVALSGHVIVQAQSDNNYWLLDPDYGVLIKHSINEVEKNPAIIASYYSKKGFSEERIAGLMTIYDSKGNSISRRGVSGYPDCYPRKIMIEKISYILIWLIPLMLISPLLALLVIAKRKSIE